MRIVEVSQIRSQVFAGLGGGRSIIVHIPIKLYGELHQIINGHVVKPSELIKSLRAGRPLSPLIVRIGLPDNAKERRYIVLRVIVYDP